jgi:hypothetical protein
MILVRRHSSSQPSVVPELRFGQLCEVCYTAEQKLSQVGYNCIANDSALRHNATIRKSVLR